MLRVRVLVVDDSVVVRRLVSDVLSGDPRIEVVGAAANGKIALAKIAQVNPDLITLDIEMPVMDGLETLVELKKSFPKIPVIMFSTLTERGASSTLRALELGALDYVTKPANVGSVTASMDAVRAQLVPKIIALTSRVVPQSRSPLGSAGMSARHVPPAAPAAVIRPPDLAPQRVDVLTIGVSTGGPDALTTLLSTLPADLPVPVVVVQHMPPVFTRQFADRMNSKSALQIKEAAPGDEVVAGRVLIAAGDFHLRLKRRAGAVVATLDQGVPENYCRPAVDVLFRSVVEVYGAHVLGVVLTGMGSDGARSCADVVRAGGTVMVQDQATSVVWGMPGAVATAGLASKILPLSEIAPAILSRLRVGRTMRPLVAG